MVENTNASKNPSTGEYLDIPKYVGVASVNVKAINPSNAALRKFGWNIPEDAKEPAYVKYEEKDGRLVPVGARIRFLVQIQDLEDKPIVPLDFRVKPGLYIAEEKRDDSGTLIKPAKCKVIDAYGRTAWGTKPELKEHKIPQYTNGPADISPDYKACGRGQEELVKFLFKYLNITPLKVYDNKTNEYVATKTPGKLTIDNWDAVSTGNVKELCDYVALQPENRVKVILGVQTDDNNRTYQTFIDSTYISNGARVDAATGEFSSARKAIDKFNERSNAESYTFSAAPVKRYTETATEVKDNSSSMFESTSNSFDNPEEDLPF